MNHVPVNANVRLLFSGPIDPLTVTGAAIQLSGGSSQMVGAISFSNNSQTVSFMPQDPLPASTLMTLTVTGVKDLAGNAVAAQTTHFTTGTAPAVATPAVVNTNPPANATNVPVNVAIALQTNAPIDATTVNPSTFQVRDNTVNQNVAGTYSVSADGLTVYFVGNTPLPTGRSYSVNFAYQGMTDVAGNQLSGCCGGIYNFSFSSGFTTSTAAPQVTGISPADGLTQVPINAQMTVQFNEPVNSQTLNQVTLSRGGTAVSVVRRLANGNQTLIVIPVITMSANTSYTLNITGVGDLSGHTMSSAVISSFTTGPGVDFNQPVITAMDPSNGMVGVPTNALIRVRFNKQVAVSQNSIQVYPSSAGQSVLIPGTVTILADGLSASFKPTAPLQAGTQFGISINGVTDLEGQSVTGNSTFTTGAGPQTTAPAVTLVTPPNGTTGVPVNAVIQVQFSAPVSAVGVTNSAMALSSGTAAVTGTVTLTSNNTVLTFAPAAALSASTSYTLTVAGLTDLAGNAIATLTSTFTTGAATAPDKTAPAVTAITPGNGTTGVPVNTSIVVTFSEPVNPLTVTTQTISLQAKGAVLAGTYAVNGAIVTFTPLTPLPATTQVNVSVNGSVQDLAGNGSSGRSSSFTTAATADTTAPAIVSITPNDGATGMGPNGQVVIVFSESMNPSTLTASGYTPSGFFYNNFGLLANGNRLSFNLSVSSDNRVVTLSGVNLPQSSVVTAVVTHDVQDLSGNPLADFQSQFATAPNFDTTHASVVSQRPGNGSTGVPVTGNIVLYVNEPLNVATVPAALHVSQNGQLVNGTVNVANNGETIQFVPSTPFQYGALVQVFLDSTATNNDGVGAYNYQGSFTILPDPNTATPVVISTSPSYGMTNVPLNAVVEVGFNEALDPATVNANTVLMFGPNGNVATTLSLDTTGTVIRIVPNAVLVANNYYNVYIQNGIQGVNGKPASTYYTYFYTGTASQTAAPSVVSISPADQMNHVPVNANVRLLFSGPIDPLTVTGAAIQLSGGSSQMVGAISFSNNSQTVSFIPQDPLPASTLMTLTVTGVKDLAGNAVAAQTTHFTTGTAPAVATPVVVNTNPSSNAANVPVNVAIALQTNAAIDATTVNPSTFQVRDNTVNQN